MSLPYNKSGEVSTADKKCVRDFVSRSERLEIRSLLEEELSEKDERCSNSSMVGRTSLIQAAAMCV